MTTYTVTWHQQALDELTEVCTAAGRRKAVADRAGALVRVFVDIENDPVDIVTPYS